MMIETVELDEEAFLGYVERSYYQEGEELRELYKEVCKAFSECPRDLDASICEDERLACRDGEVRVTVRYDPEQGVFIEANSSIGGAVLSPKEVELVRLADKTARDKEFRVLSIYRNEFGSN